MELIKIKASDYGLEENKAKQISDMFKPMLDKMVELETEFNEISNLEISPLVCNQAKELRLQYVKVRTGTAKIHKELKDFYLQGGRFVDGWKNAQLMASQGIEEKLMNIEKYYENLEIEKQAKLQEERSKQLDLYEVEIIPNDLGKMEEQVWNNYLFGVKSHYETKKEAERKAEEERIAKEKAEAEERERIRLENIKLKEEAEKRIKAEARQKKLFEDKLRKEREEKERIEKEEREKREKLEAELKAKEEEKIAKEKAVEDEKQFNLSKDDNLKVDDLVNDLELLKTKYSFKSKKYITKYDQVKNELNKIIKIIKE